MSYDSRVYRILIASPSDVEEEREIAVRVIQEWNDLYSYSRKVVLLPLRWETHTAPEYGIRPQEVINRTIVDQCDLLVGIFWTRIGSPTGEAESGTLEEIERVGHAGKPIMLYFSKIGIDPDKLDLNQVKRLQQFKEKTYPNSLTESYKSIIEFRDKLAKQLELKVRDLQKAETSAPPPLLLSFMSPETRELLGDKLSRIVRIPVVKDLDSTIKSHDKKSEKEIIQAAVFQRIREAIAFPSVLVIRNASSFSVRDLYIEVSIRAGRMTTEVVDSIGPGWDPTVHTYWVTAMSRLSESPLETELTRNLAHFEEKGLKKEKEGWSFSFEWQAIQPQRVRVVRPIVFVIAKESDSVVFTARVLADGFPQPMILKTTLDLTVQQAIVNTEQILPNLESLLSRSERTKTESIFIDR